MFISERDFSMGNRQMYGISMVFAEPPKSVMFSNPNRE